MSMAIKYAMQKHAKKMSRGGACDEHGTEMCEMCHGGKMAEGGFVEEEKESGYERMPEGREKMDSAAMMEDEDMISRIMKQRYSKGGRIANDTPITADFEDNQFDDLVKDDDLEMHYTGQNSGDEIGNEKMDEDDRDLIARIMKSRRSKDRMPHPM